MKCEICNRGVPDGVDLYRVNPKGIEGIWRCWKDMTAEQRKKHEENRAFMEVLNK
jgi:hypothetical protein